jgi:amino acid adenylation domain-containing protein/non-ribosomal peptide synthase protein (TIGR01720 family)
VVDVDFISARDREQVWSWNHDEAITENHCAHDLIQRRAESQPEALAVSAWDEELTYRELDRLSTRLANHLVNLGIGPEVIVPLCFEKSAWAIVSMLAVLKAGAAMVFLDPAHPPSRRAEIINQVKAKVVVASSQKSTLFADSMLEVVAVDRAAVEALPAHDSLPKTGVSPENLLYVIFTSGSTGQPKGCLIEHRMFCSGSLRHAEGSNLVPRSRVLQLASYCFDVSILEILTALISGACVCTPHESAMGQGIASIINSFEISWAFLTPSLVKLVKPTDVPTLKTLILGGEALAKVDIETWAEYLQLINGYGPSECSIAAVGNPHITKETDPRNIGHAIGGVCWIVDARDHNRLVPVGAVGELLIEGPILSRGYLDMPEKTAAAFIERPAWGPVDRSGKPRRLYKTGDLARYNSEDGSFHFIGRKDTQVKLRGLRIELGEIEHHVSTDPNVEHGMVILPESGILKQRLVAVVSFQNSATEAATGAESGLRLVSPEARRAAELAIAALREKLSGLLPSYMVPTTWLVVASIPLLISGKLNRTLVKKSIVELDEETYSTFVDFEAKDDEEGELTDTERTLRDIISQTLNLRVDQIPLSRSFLSLGGDSISAMQLMAACRKAGIAIKLKDILRRSSISELALCAGAADATSFSKEESFDTPFGLSPVQRMYASKLSEDVENASETHFNQSFLLRLTREVAPEHIQAGLEAVVQQHSMLRARWTKHEDGQWSQRALAEAADSYAFTIHASGTPEEIESGMAATQRILDLQRGPVFAADLFKTGGEGDVLFLAAHHAIIDLVSWRVIMRDLEEFLTTGMLSSEKPLPFQTWLQLQYDHENRPLGDSFLSTTLPYDVPSPLFEYWEMSGKPNTMGDTLEERLVIDQDATALLLGAACHSALGTEPIDFLLSSLLFSFGKTFNDRSLPPLFREGHGREPWDGAVDISDTVGWFTTMYPLSIEYDQAYSIMDVVKRVKDTRHRVPDNGRPYFASRYLNPEGIKAFGHHDEVELSFDYLGLYQQLERDDALFRNEPREKYLAGDDYLAGGDVGRNVPRFALVEITAEVIAGQMQFSFVYNRHMRNQAGIHDWILQCRQSLLSAITQSLTAKSEPTLSNFPLLPLTYSGLGRLVGDVLPGAGIRLDAIEDIYPCSPMQQGLIISQDTASDEYYQYYHTLAVTPTKAGETVDVARLENAWKSVVHRNSSLRTVFIRSVGRDGLYDQVVLKEVTPRTVHVKGEKSDADILFQTQEAIGYRGNEPPHRFTICETSTGEAFCKLDINHAIIDGESIANLLGDLILAYDGKLPAKPGFLYSDYISFTRSRPVDLALDFWKQHLADVQPCLVPSLAYLEDSKEEKKLGYVELDCGVPMALMSKFCSEHNVTLVNVFQVAWALTLRAWTELDQVCFGYLSSGRDAPLPGIEEGIGAFLTMLVCRVDLEGTVTLEDALQTAADDFIQSLPNQYCGLAAIQHALKFGTQPLFNTVMSFHREYSGSQAEHDIAIEGIHGHDPTEYTVSLGIGVSDEKVKVTLEYWTTDFVHQQVVNIGSTFMKAVESIILQTKSQVKDVDLVSEDHLRQMEIFNSRTPQKVNRCVHEVIRDTVLAYPDEEAVCGWDRTFTYSELDKLSSQLAHYLVERGVGPEVIVPFCFQKSAWTIVAMLATLKAGGACVALDPNHPINRLEGLIEVVDATIILAAPQNCHLFANTPSIKHIVAVDQSLFEKLPTVAGPPSTNVAPNNPAFVVFTSGTTGKPKAIVLEHSAMTTSTASMGPMIGLGPGTRVCQFASYTFDVSIQDMFGTLQRGGTVCVFSDYEKMNDLAGAINRYRCNWADLTSTVVNLLRPEQIPTMRTYSLGGEAVTREIVETWADHVRLINAYGPAECAVNMSVSKPMSKHSNPSNIGPAYGALAWVVDPVDDNRLVPVGCAGELLIEGPMLARHYLKDPVKTREAFIENPAWVKNFKSSDVTRRFYKTGDLVRFNTDGSLTCIGRRDTQVKINGQRVELDEITYQVQAQLAEGHKVAVDAIDIPSHARGKTLVAFISSPHHDAHDRDQSKLELPMTAALRAQFNDLQTELARVLPTYMIPSMYVPIGVMPSTMNGKLDRKRLRQTVLAFSKEEASEYMLDDGQRKAPSTNMEKSLHKIWVDVLGIDGASLGVNHHFFRLGGDSVGAMRVVTAARAQNISLSVADVFQHPFLSEMAAAAKALTDDAEAGAVSEPFNLLKDQSDDLEAILEEAKSQCGVNREDIEDIYPCTALQEGLMALSAKQQGAYVGQKAFRLPSDGFDLEKFKATWEAVIKSEAILRTRIIDARHSGSLQVVLSSGLSWKHATDLETYLAEDLCLPFSYGAPLTRLAIVENDDGASYFVWTAHHAAYDGWSVPLLFSHVERIFKGLNTTSTTPYKGFIEYLSEVQPDAESGFWTSQLSSKGGRPTSFPDAPAGYQARPDQKQLHRVQMKQQPDSDYTTSAFLRAAWAFTMAQYLDSEDIVFAATLSGRNAPVSGIDTMVGPAITTVPIRVRLDLETASVRDYLKAIHEQSTTMIPFEHTGLQNIRLLDADARAAVDGIQNLFVVQPSASDEPFLDLEEVPMHLDQFDTYPLVIECSLGEHDALSIEARYDQSIISAEQVQRMLHHFERVIHQLNEAANKTLRSVEMLSSRDIEDIKLWNRDLPEACNKCVHDIISEQALARPQAQAICAWDGDFTYAELDTVTMKLAYYLKSLGVGPEIKVGLCFDKSKWTPVAMLGIMKAGGTCVALSPAYPMPRMMSILEDIDATIVLTAPQHSSLFDGIVPHIITIEPSFIDALPSAPSGERISDVRPENAALVLFTSGSTGKPKGAMILHRGLCTMRFYQSGPMHMDQNARVLQFAAYTFDVSNSECFTTLMGGGCVCIPSEYERMNDLAGAINRYNINWLFLVPTVADTLRPEQVPNLKSLILGGEVIRPDLHQRWADKVRLINSYGPAECSIWTAWELLTPNTAPSTIGKGLGCRTWVVNKDNHDHLTPVGCVGELLVEGPIVSRGYVKNPEKTQEAYVNDPAWSQRLTFQPMRLYKTGDLVRYGSDGNLHYVGRKDTQVKMRGQRVELSEIEHNININNFKATQSAVERIYLQGDIEKPALAAFLQVETAASEKLENGLLPLTEELKLELLELQKSLGGSLQSYMVPSVYIPLSEMPTTQTGKIDRKTLRQIGSTLPESQLEQYLLADAEATKQKRAPSTPMERKLQSLWAEVLKVSIESIGADDGFFQKGGDSIRAMRLAAAASASQISLTVAQIFGHSKLCEMAEIASASAPSTIISDVKPFSFFDADSVSTVVRDAAVQCGINEKSIEDIYPATPLQEGLMALSIQQQGAYISPRIFRLEGLDIERFKKAWETAVFLYPILRTRIIPGESSHASQVVVQEKIDWDRAESAHEYMTAVKAKFGGYGRPLVDFAITADGTKFLWTIHHSLYDGYSSAMVFSAVRRIYDGESVPTSVPFSSFIQYLATVDPNDASQFWRSQLEGGAPTSFPQLPSKTYEPRPDKQLSKSFTVSQASGSSIVRSTILRAAWAIVTARYEDSDDVVFGVTLSGRSSPVAGIETMMAPTFTTVPVRIRLNREQAVSEFLQAVQSQSTEMIPYEHTGLQRIKGLGPEVQAALNFRNLFVVQQSDVDSREEGFLSEIQDDDLFAGFDTYAIVIECNLTDDRTVDIEVRFDSNVVGVPQMQRVLDQFKHVVNQLSELSQSQETSIARVGDVEVLSPEDLAQLLEWNADGRWEVVDTSVHEIIKSQVQERPEAIAVSSWDGELTYAQLDNLSSRLAHYLVEKGVKPEVLVPLCFDKSLWTVVAMLAVLKAGGACVHLGANHPLARLKEILNDINAEILLAAPQHAHKFTDLIEVFEVEQSTIANLTATSPLPIVAPNNPAFVLFTSGSTGKPKGIVVEHGCLSSSSQAHGAQWNVGPGTRVFQFAAYTFDVSVADIFTTLQRGGCICIPSEKERIDDLPGAINRLNANWAFLTPTVAQLLPPNEVPCLKTLVLGGEASTVENIKAFANVLDLIVCYGPAETSIYCSGAPPATLQSNPSNLGRSIGCSMWICDPSDHNRLLPVGCVGEIVIEGRIVARGYLHDEAKTKAAFVENPAWAKPAAAPRRMYKTGDLGRYNPDGTISYVSRKDNQIKLHGQRIELPEIEHHLLAQNQVSHAMALVPRAGLSKNRLVAVLALHSVPVVSESGAQVKLLTGLRRERAQLEVSAIRDALANMVPVYMVPAIWLVAETIPLTPNGKLNRLEMKKWLEEMDQQTYEELMMSSDTKDGSEVLATAQEACLREVIGEVLNMPNVDLKKSFLKLGGDSIAAMQVRSKCRSKGISVSVQDILRSQDISELALKATFNVGSKVALEEVVDTPFALTPIQQMYFEYAQVEDSGRLETFNQSFLLRLTEKTSVSKLGRAIDAVVRQHSMLRSRFVQDPSGQWTQLITNNVSESYRFDAHEVASRAEVAPILSGLPETLDVRTGPVFAADLFNIDGDGQVLFVTAHHLVVDLVSWRIILHDLEELLSKGTLSTPKALSFQAWSQMQEKRAETLKPELALPIDIPEQDVSYWGLRGSQNVYGETVERAFTLDVDTTTKLFGTSNTAFRTEPVEIILAAIMHSFASVFADRSVPTFFIEGHGREPWDADIDPSATVGWFTAMSPIHVPGDKDILRMLQQTKDLRRRVPSNGWDYFTSRYLTEAGKKAFRHHSDMEVLFNYAGRYQQLEKDDALIREEPRVAGETFSDQAPSMRRYALIDISAEVRDGQALISFAFNPKMRHQDKLNLWVQESQRSLTALPSQLEKIEAAITLSDFPLLSLDHSGLGSLNELLSTAHLKPHDVEDIYPCVPMQNRMLQSQQRWPGTYEVQMLYSMSSSDTSAPVSLSKVRSAWQKVVDRHAALRTIFVSSVSRLGEFDQIVLRKSDANVQHIKCDDSDVHSTMETHVSFDYTERRPHNQLTVFETASGKAYFKLEISHALNDGMSTGIMLHDLMLAYEDRLPAGPGPQFSGYVSYLKQLDLDPAIAYWKQYFADTEPCHLPSLPKDDVAQHQSDIEIHLGPEAAQLPSFCKARGVSMAAVIQTIWALVLRKFTNSEKVLFGYMTANRDVPVDGVAGLVGPLINMLICRMQIDEKAVISQLMETSHQEFLENLPHQQGLVDAVAQLEREMGATKPLWNTVMSLQYDSRREVAVAEEEKKTNVTFDWIGGADPNEVSKLHNHRFGIFCLHANDDIL